jgi:hypothetical protein
VTYGCRSRSLTSDLTNAAHATGVSPRGVSVRANDCAVVIVRAATAPAPPLETPPPFTG